MVILIQIIGWVGILFFALSAYIVAEACYYQVWLGRALERDLGFRDGSAYVRVGRRLNSAVALGSVAEGGVLAQAGFRAGDVVPDLSHSGLFRLLHRHRGREVELAVVDGGEGPAFSQRPKRVLRFAVPGRGKHV